MVLGADHYLPARFANLRQTLVWQAVVCSTFLLAMQAGENLRTGYQLLVDMMVITYFIPFLYIFLAAWRLTGLRAAASAGIVVTVIALTLSFVPPDGVALIWLFEAKLVAGSALVAAVARWWFVRRSKAGNQARSRLSGGLGQKNA